MIFILEDESQLWKCKIALYLYIIRKKKRPVCDRIPPVEVFFRPDLRTGVMVMLRTVLKWDISEPSLNCGQNQWSLWAAASTGTVEAILCVRTALRPSVSILELTPSVQNLSCVVTTGLELHGPCVQCWAGQQTRPKVKTLFPVSHKKSLHTGKVLFLLLHTFLSKILDMNGKQAGKKMHLFTCVVRVAYALFRVLVSLKHSMWFKLMFVYCVIKLKHFQIVCSSVMQSCTFLNHHKKCMIINSGKTWAYNQHNDHDLWNYKVDYWMDTRLLFVLGCC